VDQASNSIREATIDTNPSGPPTVNPTAGSAEVREQLEAHPELADEILEASAQSLDDIGTALDEPGVDQQTVNTVVDNLSRATEKAGEYGRDRLGQTVAQGDREQIKVALASTRSAGAAALTEKTSHHLPEGSRANFRTDVGVVREAANAVASAYAPSATYPNENPAGAAAALQAQIEAHPELVSAITLAAQPTLDNIATWLEENPNETATIELLTQSFSAVSNIAGPDGDAAIVETLSVLDPNNEGLINGIALASLDNQVDLGHDLAEHHGETAGAGLERATQVGAQVREIDELIAAGDLTSAYAASQQLRNYAADGPPGIATALLQGLDDVGAIDRLTGILGASAADADADGYGSDEGSPQEAFDGVIMDLSFVATRSGDLTLTQEVGASLAGSMDPDDIERYDEAFHNAVASGQGADLTAAVIEELNAAGRTEQAGHVLDELDSGLHDLQEHFHGQANTRDQAFAELGYLQQQFGPLGTEEEQAAAAAAFLENFPEIDEVERLGGVMATDLDVIARLRESVPNLDVEDLDDNEEDMLREFPRFANTVEGSARVAEALEAQTKGHSTFLDRLTSVDYEGDERTAFMEQSGLALNRSAIQQASSAVALGDPARAELILDGLLTLTGAAEIQGVENISDLEPLVDAMGEVARAGASDNPPPSIFQTAQNTFSTAISGLEDQGLRIESNPRLRILTGGAAFVGAAGIIAGGKPANFQEWVGLLGSTGEVAFGAAEVVGAFRGLSGTALNRLALGGSVAGLVGAGVSAWSAIDAAGDGDYAAAGLHAGAAVGGALVAFGTTAAATGVGAVLVVGAAAGLYQLGRVRASNVHENGNTEDYIRALIPHAEDGVITHLRNSDDESINVGIVIQAAARRLGIDPPEFFDRLGELSPDQVIELVESAHGIVDSDHSTVDELRQTHASDSSVGDLVWLNQSTYEYHSMDSEGMLGDPVSPEQTEHLRGQYQIKYSPLGDDLYTRLQGTSVIAPASVQGWINYYEYLTGDSLG